MRSPAPQAPGWYPDRSDSSLVRYWDGQGWTGRLRPRPVWAPAHTEIIRLGPSPRHQPRMRDRLAAVLVLSMIAVLAVGAVLTSRSRVLIGAARGKVTPTITSTRYVQEANTACTAVLGPSIDAGRPRAPAPPAPATPAPATPAPATPVLLPATIPAATRARTDGTAAPGPAPSAPNPTARAPATGTTSGDEAKSAAGIQLAGAGIQPAGAGIQPAGAGIQPAAAVARARLTASRTAAVSSRLAALPRQLGDAAAVAIWLTEWNVAASAASRYAAALSAGNPHPSLLKATYQQARRRVDSFARVNGLDHCRL